MHKSGAGRKAHYQHVSAIKTLPSWSSVNLCVPSPADYSINQLNILTRECGLLGTSTPTAPCFSTYAFNT